MTSRYIGQINAKYNSTDIIITPDRAAADQDGAPIVNTTGAQTISGAKTFSGSTTFTGKVTASNAGNSLKVANHDTALISNDVLSAKDINTPNGDANNLVHRSGITGESVTIPLTVDRSGSYFGENMLYFQSHGNADGTFPSIERHGLMVRHSSDSGTPSSFQARLFILFNTDGSGELRFDVSKKWSDGTSSYKSKTLAKFTAEGVIS